MTIVAMRPQHWQQMPYCVSQDVNATSQTNRASHQQVHHE